MNITTVKVECFFAVCASVLGCKVDFNNSLLNVTFGDKIEHTNSALHTSSSGFIDIPQAIQLEVMQGLRPVVFDVKVYDINIDDSINADDGPAYEEYRALELKLDNTEPSPDMATSIIGKKDVNTVTV